MAAPGLSLSEAPASAAWVLSDGKAGDEGPCVALVEALGSRPDIRRVAPRRLFASLGIVDPRERPGRPAGPLRPPCPDLVVASGRRTIPYLDAVKQASGGRAFTVFLKDPRRGPGIADLIWVPEHDRLRGPNVVATLTGPHGVSPARLDAARRDPDPRLAGVRRPRVAVLVGGDSRHHHFTQADAARLLADLRRLAEAGAGLMITVSRRTPRRLAADLATLAASVGGFFWTGEGENPYVAMLALGERVVVTADSANMIGEAAATGRPILVFTPSGGHPRLARFLAAMEARGITTPFVGMLEGRDYPPLDATRTIAEAVAAGLARHRAGLARVSSRVSARPEG